MEIKIGCCGWGYFRSADYYGKDWKKKYESVLAAYASKFDLVEVNSTFYRLPKVKTAEKWFEEAKGVNKRFEFTVKASQIITHMAKFSERGIDAFETSADICEALKAKILLFQSPGSFSPSDENIERMKEFFGKIKRRDILFAWEPRGKWWDEQERIEEVCKKFELIHCVDPFRNKPLYFGKNKIAYFRLHGFGKPTMYNYVFSDKELSKLKGIVSELKCREVYVLFNNMAMYEDALRFEKLI